MDRSFSKALAAGLTAAVMLGLPATASAEQPGYNQQQRQSLAYATYLVQVAECTQVAVTVYAEEVSSKSQETPVEVSATTAASIQTGNNCIGSWYSFDGIQVVGDFSVAEFRSTRSATVDFSGTTAQGYPIEVSLTWTADGPPTAHAFRDVGGDHGSCRYTMGHVNHLSPTTVTGSVSYAGNDLIAGQAPVDSVLYYDVRASVAVCHLRPS